MSNDRDAPTRCTRCGEVYQRRYMTGIGSAARMTWLCGNCVLNGGADEAFAGIRRSIDAAIRNELNQENPQ